MTLRRGLCVLFFRYFLSSTIFVILVLCVGTLLLNSLTVEKGCSTIPDWFLENPDAAQDDVRLLKYIKKYHLEPPSSEPYNPTIIGLPDPSSLGFLIQRIFKKKRKGFFVEAGAFNGIQESNTLVLERDFGWTGILIEPNSFIIPELRRAHRKAWIADICLALTSHPQKVHFVHHLKEPSGGTIEYSALLQNPRLTTVKSNRKRGKLLISAGYVECFPVFSVLAALNVSTVDYFSLDVKGAELKVLEGIPFKTVDIKVFSVDHEFLEGGLGGLDGFFGSKNYSRIAQTGSDAFYAQNAVLSDYELDEGLPAGIPD